MVYILSTIFSPSPTTWPQSSVVFQEIENVEMLDVEPDTLKEKESSADIITQELSDSEVKYRFRR